MAAKPRLTVRLAPSMLHALEFVAERETVAPAELARTILSAALQEYLARHNLRAQCQDAYMLWLRPATSGDDIDLLDEDLGVQGQDDPWNPAPPPANVSGADGPSGPSATVQRPIDYSEQPPKALSQIVAEADRLVERFTPRGRRKSGA